MQAIRLEKTVEVDGQLNLTGLPYHKGDRVELILLSPPTNGEPRRLTARGLLESGLVGLWGDRSDVADSPEFARQLREQAQRRDLP